MGSGKGKSRRAQSVAVLDQLSPSKTRNELVSTFSRSGYTLYNGLSQEDRRVADPRLWDRDVWRRGILDNEDKPVRTCTPLYHYSPEMNRLRGPRISVDLVLDHESGDIFTVSCVKKHVTFSDPQEVYQVHDCGRKLGDAIQHAEAVYDSAFHQLKASHLGRGLEQVMPKTVREAGVQKITQCDRPPSLEKENIYAALIDGLQEAQQSKLIPAVYQMPPKAIVEQAAQLGYV